MNDIHFQCKMKSPVSVDSYRLPIALIDLLTIALYYCFFPPLSHQRKLLFYDRASKSFTPSYHNAHTLL